MLTVTDMVTVRFIDGILIERRRMLNAVWLSTDRHHTQKHSVYMYVCYVLLTVHLSMIFVNNQLDAQFFFMCAYFYSLHVSGSHVPIIRRINCINVTPGICTCVDDRLVCRSEFHSNLHTRRSSTQSDIYQVSHCKN